MVAGDASVSSFHPLGDETMKHAPLSGSLPRNAERNTDETGEPVEVKSLALQWFERQASRNTERNTDETAHVPRCFTLFRRLKHLSDVSAVDVVRRDLARPGWSVADWRAFFDERAAIAQIDGGLDRVQAERHAYTDCVRQFLRRHPPGYRPDVNCLQCGGMVIKAEAWPLVCPDNLARWVHHSCFEDFRLLRVRDAVLCLDRLGIVDPEQVSA